MNGYLDIVVYNVERGNAIWVSLPDGKNLMFDIGRRGDFSPLWDMRGKGVRYLDGLVITHPHTDHFDDIHSFNKYFGMDGTSYFIRPAHLDYGDIYNGNNNKELVNEYWKLNASFKDYFGSNSYITWDIGGAHLDIFRPHVFSASNLNNHSLVTFISYRGHTVLLPGDCESAAWNELMDMPEFPIIAARTNIFVVPHHGLASAYNEKFMASISPDVCIISEKAVTDTDVCSCYSRKGRGHSATIRGNYVPMRYALTTRNDGNIRVSIIPNVDGSSYYAIRTFE